MKKLSDIANRKLTISLGADHGAFEAKNAIAEFLKGAGHDVLDCGAFALDPEDDYPDFAVPAAKAVATGNADAAILFCRSGIGVSIAANRYHGVRAALCHTQKNVLSSRQHNCSNCLVLSGDNLSLDEMKDYITLWLATDYSGDARHTRRLEKLETASYDDIAALRDADPELAAMIDREAARQNDGIELIASENFAS